MNSTPCRSKQRISSLEFSCNHADQEAELGQTYIKKFRRGRPENESKTEDDT